MPANASGSVHWHTEYDAQQPPAKPDPRYVRFVSISDTHSTQPQCVPDGDVLLHSGDLTDIGGTQAFVEQLHWLGSLPHRHKFIIAGNHDFGLCTQQDWYAQHGKRIHETLGHEHADTEAIKRAIDKWQREAPSGTTHKYVEDERIEFDEGGRRWSLYGSPWSPEFGGWAWNYKRGDDAKALVNDFPQADILLTHGPPHNIGNLDLITDGRTHVGCEELTSQLTSGRIRPLLHCFGHIHEAYGAHLQTWGDDKGGAYKETLFANAALVEMDKKAMASLVQAFGGGGHGGDASARGRPGAKRKHVLVYDVVNLCVYVGGTPACMTAVFGSAVPLTRMHHDTAPSL